MPADILENHTHTTRCNIETGVWLQWRSVDLGNISGNMEFILYVRKGYALVEGMAQFEYVGRAMDQSYNEWLAIL